MHEIDKKSSNSQSKLSQDQKAEMIEKLRNFPTLPEMIVPDQRNKNAVLAQSFPLGCSKLVQSVRHFKSQDRLCDLRFNDFVNICIGIKYGICTFPNLKDLKFIINQFEQANCHGGNLYLLLIDKGYQRQKIMALAKVNEIKPNLTFKFWHLKKGNLYPLGIANIEVIAFGQLDYQEYRGNKIQQICYDLRQSIMKWECLKTADDFEWMQRKKIIIAVNENKIDSMQSQIYNQNISKFQQA